MRTKAEYVHTSSAIIRTYVHMYVVCTKTHICSYICTYVGMHSTCVYAQVWRVCRLLLLCVNVQHHGKDATHAHSMQRNQLSLDL